MQFTGHSSYHGSTSHKPSDSNALAKTNPATYKSKEEKKIFCASVNLCSATVYRANGQVRGNMGVDVRDYEKIL